MKKRIGSYPHVCVEGEGRSVVSQGRGCATDQNGMQGQSGRGDINSIGGVVQPRAVHDPGMVLLDVALAVAWAGTAWLMWACSGPSWPSSGLGLRSDSLPVDR